MPALAGLFLNVLAPVFLLLGIGYIATKPLQLNAQTLSRIAYYILTPAFVFTLIGNAKVEAQLATRMVGFITAVYVGSVALAFAVARLLRRDQPTTIAYMMIAAFGNVGNFGLPISQFAEGNAALLPATIYFLANLVFAFVVCLMLANMGRGNLLNAIVRVLKTPALIALVPALLVNILGIPVPALVSRASELLSNALVAIMLLALGVQLASAGPIKLTPDMLIAAGIRLISGPVLAFALAGVFALPLFERNVGILQASMPAAVLVSIIALENNVVPAFVTPTVLFSNLASVVTLTLVLARLNG